MVDTAIIGAGPYGLSIAAHLKARGVEYRIFGSPMHTWRTHMPKGMLLKSDGFASCLYDPDSSFTLGRYCQEQGIPYADLGLPVRLETFSSYGQEFQKRLVPELEDKLVVSMRRSLAGFDIHLEGGELVTARKIVAAVGISHFEYVPPVLSALPDELVTHSSRHTTFDRFKGRDVTVVGAGASALDVAALLHQAGASVQLVARKPVVTFHNPPGPIPRPLMERLRSPTTGLGPGWRSLFCTRAPLVFHAMPQWFRLEVVRRHLGPAAGWFVKDMVIGHVAFHLGFNVAEANVQNGRVQLRLASSDGAQQTLVTDHVIAGTGYQVDLRRLAFLNAKLLAEVRSVDNAPVLSRNFESSVPGLYFVGTTSANSFGPMARFAYGARFTAKRLSQCLARGSRRFA
jgi:thioredoxin reductase